MKETSDLGGGAFLGFYVRAPASGFLTERMRISSNGNVSVGTAIAPEARLDARGTVMSQSASGNNDNFVMKKTGEVGPSNVKFTLSHRSNGTEAWMFGSDGSTFRNLQGWDYAGNRVRFPANGNTLVVDNANGRVGMGTASPVARLHVVSIEGAGVLGESPTTGIFGRGTGGFGIGVYGHGENVGVLGLSTNDGGRGGEFAATGQNGRGVFASGDIGVRAVSGAPTGTAYGVSAETQSTGGRGVFGRASAATGPTRGVLGEVESTSGVGVLGSAKAATGSAHGVLGETASTSGRGVIGRATAATGTTIGVRGEVESDEGAGVFGQANATSGSAYGVIGESASVDGAGVLGRSTTGLDGVGVLGVNSSGYAGIFVGNAIVWGRTGLGQEAHASYRLALPNNANDSGRAIANRWDTYSSARHKENVRPLDGALDKVLRLRGVAFDWKQEEGGPDIGFIAEEVAQVLPEIVTFDASGEHAEAMDYSRLTALSIEAVKELNDRLVRKQDHIAELEARLERLERLLASTAPEP